MPKDKKTCDIKHRITLMEKEIFTLTGDKRAKARTEYQQLLKLYRKEGGLEEPIYLKRA
jgi:hypothetical protein